MDKLIHVIDEDLEAELNEEQTIVAIRLLVRWVLRRSERQRTRNTTSKVEVEGD